MQLTEALLPLTVLSINCFLNHHEDAVSVWLLRTTSLPSVVHTIIEKNLRSNLVSSVPRQSSRQSGAKPPSC